MGSHWCSQIHNRKGERRLPETKVWLHNKIKNLERWKFGFTHSVAQSSKRDTQDNDFIEWCKSSFLNINVAKMETCIDFRKNPTVISPEMMDNHAVELVQQYKYLRTVVDNELCFDPHDVCKKSTSAYALLL